MKSKVYACTGLALTGGNWYKSPAANIDFPAKGWSGNLKNSIKRWLIWWRTFLDTIDISSIIISFTSGNLFRSVASVLASKGYSLPRHGKFNAEWVVVPFTLILATPVVGLKLKL